MAGTKIGASGITYPDNSVSLNHFPYVHGWVHATSGNGDTSIPNSRKIILNVLSLNQPSATGDYAYLMISSRLNGAKTGSTYLGGTLFSTDSAGTVYNESSIAGAGGVKLTPAMENLSITQNPIFWNGQIHIDRCDDYSGTELRYIVSWHLTGYDQVISASAEPVACFGTCHVTLASGQSGYLKNIGLSYSGTTPSYNNAQYFSVY